MCFTSKLNLVSIIISSKKIQMNTYIKLLLVSSLLIAGLFANAQNTVSPYSIFGPGEIQSGGFGTNKGMGSAGIALESGSYLNNLNPASYAGMDSLRLIMEFGLEGKSYDISSANESVSGFEGNLAYLALGFKYTPWLGGSFGLVPFSSVGYSINRTNSVEGLDHQYTSNYQGSGGISRVYFSNAIKLFKRLSLGANVSYMFGPLVQEEYIEPTTIVPEIMIERKDYLRSMYVDFGLQYKFTTQKLDYSLGATYAFEQNLNSKHITTVYDNSYSTLNTFEETSDYLVIPQIIGVGLGLKSKRNSLALDYTFQNWAGIEYPIQADEFKNSHKIAFGAELNPWEHRAINSFYKNWTYRFGVGYESSYLQFGNSTVTDTNVTLGLGIPMYGALSKMDFSVTGGLKGTKSNNLINEKYLMFNIGFSLNEIAFIQRKIN